MDIGVFSKIEIAGGSEFRCAELVCAINRHTPHRAALLAERRLDQRVAEYIRKRCDADMISDSIKFPETFYSRDALVIVNTDSKAYTTTQYWNGETDRHRSFIDLTRIRQMSFLFNFVISPAEHLDKIADICPDVRILTANRRFHDEVTTKDKFQRVRDLPRMVIESPIDPGTLVTTKTTSNIVRIGQHSKNLENKWNESYPHLIRKVNDMAPGMVKWEFMGMHPKLAERLCDMPNVTIHKEFHMPVGEFLENVDIFCFFPSWSRTEVWARSVAEAMLSGCPVVLTNKDGGNREQITDQNTGFLCDNVDAFAERIATLVSDRDLRRLMGRNARRSARAFCSDCVARKLVLFLEG